MHETVVILGEILSVVIGVGTILFFVVYPKSKVDELIKKAKETLDKNLKESETKCLDTIEKVKKHCEEELTEHEQKADKIISELRKESDARDLELSKTLSTIKDDIFQKLLDSERATNKIRQEICDKVAQSNKTFEDYNHSMLETISQLKQDENKVAANCIQLINTVKDELKNDYVTRYNDLVTMINTRVSIPEFNRLESKFDKFTQDITELKTIIQIELEQRKSK